MVSVPDAGVYQLEITANDGALSKTHGYQFTVVPNDSGVFKLNDGVTVEIVNVAVVGYSSTFEESFAIPHKGTHNTTIHHIVLSKNTVSGTPHRKLNVTVEGSARWGQYSGSVGTGNQLWNGSKGDIGIFAKDSSGKETAHFLKYYTECATHTDVDHNGICENCTLDFSCETCADSDGDTYCDTCGKTVEAETPEEPQITYGDVDGQNGVDMTDAALVLAYINGESLDENAILAADVNCRDGVDMTDISLILQYINGTIDSLPAADET